MNTYTIFLGNTAIACVSDTHSAYACYDAAVAIAEMTNRGASLVWDETAEVLAAYDPENGYMDEPDDGTSCLHCAWYWIAEGEEDPRCQFDGDVAPCEEDYETPDYDYEDDLELGFDPYCGCYTDDC